MNQPTRIAHADLEQFFLHPPRYFGTRPLRRTGPRSRSRDTNPLGLSVPSLVGSVDAGTLITAVPNPIPTGETRHGSR